MTSFDPYALVIALGTALAVVCAVRRANHTEPDATDMLAWLVLWIPFDLRWWNQLYAGPAGQYGYELWAAYVIGVALVGWGFFHRWALLGIRVPRPRDILVSVGVLSTLAALLIPPGLGSGFLQWNPSPPGLLHGAGLFGTLALTVALPEELFFRSLLQTWCERWTGRRWLGLVLASLAFGLMHWNNRPEFDEKVMYCVLASVAGIGYGLAFRYGGLFASVMTHTSVNWIWQVLLRG
ncbi:MAG TPA: CPBP family intramembrane metalloprotease [Acidobacteria bacterium]|nr:CPBP family intramembrane metalloprotease [Acidobacteriota bacterium]